MTMTAATPDTVPATAAKPGASRPAASNVVPFNHRDAFNEATVMGTLDPVLLTDRRVTWSSSRKGVRTAPGDWTSTEGTLREFLTVATRHTPANGKDGPMIVCGALAGGVRKATAVTGADCLCLDFDGGEEFDFIVEKVRASGVLGIVHTTYSHLKATSKVRRDHLAKALGDDVQPTAADVSDYLQRTKGVRPDLLDGATLEPETEHGVDGVSYVLHHRQIEKFRVILPLAATFVPSKAASTDKEAADIWRRLYEAVAAQFSAGLHDPSCSDLARAFYAPSHPKGTNAYRTVIVAGSLLDLDKVTPVADGNRFAQIAKVMGGAGAGSYQTARLAKFAARFGDVFEIEEFLMAHGWTPRGGRANGPGNHYRCPNDAAHSDPDNGQDRGFVAINGTDGENGFAAWCMHAHCKELDRLALLDLACQEAGIVDAGELLDCCPEINGRPHTLDDGASSAARAGVGKRAVQGRAAAGDSDQDTLLAEWNSKYAVVRVGKDVAVLMEPEHPGGEPDFVSERGFKNLMAPVKIDVPDGTSGSKREPVHKLWWVWEERRTYRGGIVFEPGGCGPDAYNLWRGFPVKGKAGDWGLLRSHIQDNICQGSAEHFAWLMTWLAQMFQQPGVKLGSAVAIRGKKGTGKSKLFDWVRKAMGQHALQVTSAGHITGNFNAHHAGKVLMVCEEAFWAGDRSALGPLKSLITSDVSLLERKGVDAVQASNYVRLAFISNEDWVVPVQGADERRFFVLECGDGRRQDRDFFAAVDEQMENGGLEAMVEELMTWQPPAEGWGVLRTPPKGKAHEAQALAGVGPMKKILVQLATDGILYEKGQFDGGGTKVQLEEWTDKDGTDHCNLDKLQLRAVVESYYQGRALPEDAQILQAVRLVFGGAEPRQMRVGGDKFRRVYRVPLSPKGLSARMVAQGLIEDAPKDED